MKKDMKKVMKKGVMKEALCVAYVDAMAFFTHNMEVLEERIQEKKRSGKDPAEIVKAKTRLRFAKEGVSRMLSERVQALTAGPMDNAEVLADLAALKTRARDADEQKALDNAMNLIVQQREKLTNTDRGRRALQKQLGRYKRQAKLLGKEACALKENNLELCEMLGPMIAERQSMIIAHAVHHCEAMKCIKCPFEKYCCDDSVDEETQKRRRDNMMGHLSEAMQEEK